MTDTHGTTSASDATDDELLRRLAATRDRATLALLVERHTPLAERRARRFERPGLVDDVRQAAVIGLLKALDRYDPDRGTPFPVFAAATIDGELKRFLRDHTWAVRVPRTSKELHLVVERATDELTARLGRAPTVDELAGHAGLDRDDVVRGIAAGAARRTMSLDAPRDTGGRRRPELEDERAEAALERAIDVDAAREHATALLARLPARERRIVELRIVDGLSQQAIAERVGMSQMHVSRLLRQSFDTLRELDRAMRHDTEPSAPRTREREGRG